MKRTWTIIGVADVPQSFKWYQSLFGLPETAPAHDYFGQILDSDGTVLLCLHKWGAHEHPSLTSPYYAKPGNGLLLFFRIDNFDVALPRARALVSRLEEEPHVNPSTGTAEFSLRDPDGYTSPSVRSTRPNPSIESTVKRSRMSCRVKSRHHAILEPCPLCPRKQTLLSVVGVTQSGHRPTA
jgi:catechol 2,3-dioxygenase-like lactoylglutathione lyase family enzyme